MGRCAVLAVAAVTAAVQTGGISYIGCFADCGHVPHRFVRTMPHNAGNMPQTDSPAACAAKCGASWEYFAMQDGQDCFCGNGSGYASQGVSTRCNAPCPGDRSATCGGTCANSVYFNSDGPAPPPPLPHRGTNWPPLPTPGTETDPSAFDIEWQSPSSSGARGAMPLGSGECSASVWVEPNGDMLIYVVKSDSFDELSSRDKLARLRVRLDPPLQTDTRFRQRLVLRNASVSVTSHDRTIDLFVDANAAALRLKAAGPSPFAFHASLEVWRTSNASTPIRIKDGHAIPVPPPPPEGWLQGSFCNAWNRSADMLVPQDHAGSAAIGVVHPNPGTTATALVADTLRMQGIDMAGEPVYNPMLGRAFGAWVTGADAALHRANATTLSSAKPATEHSVLVTMLTTVDKTAPTRAAAAGRWAAAAAALAKEQAAISYASAAARHAEKWDALWNRSFVHVSAPVEQHHKRGDGQVTGDPSAMLALQRYLDLANGRGARYPIHGGGQ